MAWAIYCRISKDLTGEGQGIDRQENDCRKFADLHHLEVSNTYVDNDISAFSGATRPAYEQMMQAAKDGEIEGIICWHIDRLYRRSVDLENLVELVEQTGIAVRTVKAGDLDLNTATGRMMARMVATIANFEVDHLTERLKASEEQRAAQGKWRGGYRPYGYTAVKGEGRLIINEEEAQWLRKAAQMLLDGATLRSTVKHLNAAGSLTNYGNQWRSVTLRNALLNPSIAGFSTHKKKIVGKAQWEPILDEGTWHQLRNLLTDPKRRTQQGTDRKWQGAGIYECGKCHGKVYSAGARNGKRTYMCRECGGVTRSQPNVDALIDEVIIAYLSKPENQLKLATATDPSGPNLPKLKNDRLELMARKTSLGELFGSGVIDRAQLISGTREIEAALEKIDRKISKISSLHPGMETILSSDDLAKTWSEMSPDNRAEVIDTLMKVTIMPGKTGPKFAPELIKIEWK